MVRVLFWRVFFLQKKKKKLFTFFVHIIREFDIFFIIFIFVVVKCTIPAVDDAYERVSLVCICRHRI